MSKERDDQTMADLLKQTLEVNAGMMAELRKMREDAEAKANEKPVDHSLDPARKRMRSVIEAEQARDEKNGGHFLPEDRIPCVSANGYTTDDGVQHCASFVAVTQQGRVIRLDDYRIPPEVMVPKNEGGACPFARDTMFLPNSQAPQQIMKSWLYHTFNKVDILAYVGKPVRAIAALRSDPPTSAAAE